MVEMVSGGLVGILHRRVRGILRRWIGRFGSGQGKAHGGILHIRFRAAHGNRAHIQGVDHAGGQIRGGRFPRSLVRGLLGHQFTAVAVHQSNHIRLHVALADQEKRTASAK